MPWPIPLYSPHHLVSVLTGHTKPQALVKVPIFTMTSDLWWQLNSAAYSKPPTRYLDQSTKNTTHVWVNDCYYLLTITASKLQAFAMAQTDPMLTWKLMTAFQTSRPNTQTQRLAQHKTADTDSGFLYTDEKMNAWMSYQLDRFVYVLCAKAVNKFSKYDTGWYLADTSLANNKQYAKKYWHHTQCRILFHQTPNIN